MINDTHSYEHHPTLIMLNYFVTVHLFASWCCGIITQLFAILSLVIVCSDFQARDFFHAWLAFKSLSGHFRPTQLTRWFPVWKIDFYRWRSWRKKWSCEMKTQLRHYRRFLPKLKCLVLLHFYNKLYCNSRPWLPSIRNYFSLMSFDKDWWLENFIFVL